MSIVCEEGRGDGPLLCHVFLVSCFSYYDFLNYFLILFLIIDEITRVKLWPYPDLEGSDYINANFVDVSARDAFSSIFPIKFY